ncbi:MAG TPA: hypothetical protein VKA10_05990, partial [Prolixibacteraceae bacterium]|nr:hypothetical protein [Prolixibacteraceae bacterium]
MAKNNDIEVIKVFILVIFIVISGLDVFSNPVSINTLHNTGIDYETLFVGKRKTQTVCCQNDLFSQPNQSHIQNQSFQNHPNHLINSTFHPINNPYQPLTARKSFQRYYSNSVHGPPDDLLAAAHSIPKYLPKTSLPSSSYHSKQDPEIFYFNTTSGKRMNRQDVQVPELVCPEDISTYTDINSCAAYISGNLNPQFDPASIQSLTWEMSGSINEASPENGI